MSINEKTVKLNITKNLKTKKREDAKRHPRELINSLRKDYQTEPRNWFGLNRRLSTVETVVILSFSLLYYTALFKVIF